MRSQMIAIEPPCGQLIRRVARKAVHPLIVAEIRAGVERERAIDTKNPVPPDRMLLKALARELQGCSAGVRAAGYDIEAYEVLAYSDDVYLPLVQKRSR